MSRPDPESDPVLLPCPFCASKCVDADGGDRVYCEGCGTDGPPAETTDEAVANWNRRALPTDRYAPCPVHIAHALGIAPNASVGDAEAAIMGLLARLCMVEAGWRP